MFDPKPSINKQDRNLAHAGAFDDIRKIKSIRNKMALMALLGFFTGLVVFLPAHIIFFGGVGFEARIVLVARFFGDFWGALVGAGRLDMATWLNDYWVWYFRAVAQSVSPSGFPVAIAVWKAGIVLGGWALASMVPLFLVGPLTENLDKTPKIFGDTRWANESDIEQMSQKDLVGFDGGLFLVGKMKKKLIQMKETLSVLLLAPPGTGKTVAFVVPSTVMMDRTCQMINDQKPELFHMTSGHRARVGPVFQIMWSAQDMPDGGWITEEQAKMLSPDLIETDGDGEPLRNEAGYVGVKPVFYPSWNPIGPDSLPGPGAKRDLYIERLASVLCPDPQGGDKFWHARARAALIGMIHYFVYKVEMGQDDDYPSIGEDGLPEMWHGKEPSLPMLVDWFTEAQNAVEGGGEDPMREVFAKAVADCGAMEQAQIVRTGNSLMGRAKNELTQLMYQPDRTRGSILTTLDEAFAPFKNVAVRQRTATSSFSFNELRGAPAWAAREREEAKRREAAERGETYMPRYGPDEWEPITLFICVNAEDARAFSTITGIFIDSANAYLVANGPSAIDDRGNQLGPFDFFFLLDETPTLPKLDTVINGPAVGRGKRVSYAIVGQDFAQIETRYSKPEVETMKSTTAVKVVLSQNNETTAKAISSMAGSMTYRKASYSRKEFGDPVTKFLDLKKEIIGSENYEKRDFLDSSFVMAMPKGKHVVLVQNFMNRPILSDTPLFFQEPEVAKRVFNLRTGGGPRPSAPMPARLMNRAQKARDVEVAEKRFKVDLDAARADLDAARADPQVAVVMTPQNLSDLSYGFEEDDVRVGPGEDFAVGHVALTDETSYVEAPRGDTITVTGDGERLAELTAARRVYVFDHADFDALNARIEAAGGERLPEELKLTARAEAQEIEQEPEWGFFWIGHSGSARIDRPDNLELLTPRFGFAWLCDIINIVVGCDYEYKKILLGEA